MYKLIGLVHLYNVLLLIFSRTVYEDIFLFVIVSNYFSLKPTPIYYFYGLRQLIDVLSFKLEVNITNRPYFIRELTKNCYLVTHAEWLSSIHMARCYNRDSGLYGGPVRWFNCVIEGRNEELFEERVSDQRSFYRTNASGRRFKRNSCIIPAAVDVGECVASCRRSSVTRWREVRAGNVFQELCQARFI